MTEDECTPASATIAHPIVAWVRRSLRTSVFRMAKLELRQARPSLIVPLQGPWRLLRDSLVRFLMKDGAERPRR